MNRDSACLIAESGTTYCWGDNSNGEVDVNSPDLTVLAPYALNDLGLDTIALTTDQDHVRALQSSGQVLCRSNSDSGKIGNGNKSGNLSPTTVSLDVVVSFGSSRIGLHTCAIRVDGSIWCWGRNDHGQFGNGTTADGSVPTQALATDSVEVCGGKHSTCSLTGDGTVSCWAETRRGSSETAPRSMHSRPRAERRHSNERIS